MAERIYMECLAKLFAEVSTQIKLILSSYTIGYPTELLHLLSHPEVEWQEANNNTGSEIKSLITENNKWDLTQVLLQLKSSKDVLKSSKDVWRA